MLILIILYYNTTSYKIRLFLLITSSLLFYLWNGIFDFFVFVFVVSVCFLSTILATQFQSLKKLFTTLGILTLALHLFFWKYYSDTLLVLKDQFPEAVEKLKFDPPLPLGISFFTFQGISYLADFYSDIVPKLNFKEFFLFKSFFPQLIAGPLIRPKDFIPQIKDLPTPTFVNLQEGIMLFTVGLFKKIIIADRLVQFVDNVINSPQSFDRLSLFLASVGVFVLIWADLGGFTDMGRGCAAMLGIHLPYNFLSPIFSTKPSEFWNRWHVSLGIWVREYVYQPILLRKSLLFNRYSALFLAFLFSGFWHGLRWTYVLSFLSSALFIFIEYLFLFLRLDRIFTFFPRALKYIVLNFLTIIPLCLVSATLLRIRSMDLATQYFSTLLFKPGSVRADLTVFKQSLLLTLILEAVFFYSLSQARFPLLNFLKIKISKLSSDSILGFIIINGVLGILFGILFFVCISLRRAGGSSGFIYFQF